MNRFLTIILSFIVVYCQAQTLAVWDFENTTTPAAPSSVAQNSTASSVTVGTGQTASFFTGYSSLKAISTTGFPSTATIDAAKYFEFTVTPNSGFILNISEISFHVQRSATGATAWVIRSSADNYTSDVAVSTIAIPTAFAATPHSSGSLSSNNALQSNMGVTFRLYGVSASGTSGTMRVDNLTVSGTVATANNNPLISVSTTSLSNFMTTVGTPSVTQSYTISGVNLTTDISVSAPSGFEISLSNNSGFNSSLTFNQINGSVPLTTVFVRLVGTIIGSFSGDVGHISSGATTKNIAVTGVVNPITPTIIVSTTNLSSFVTTTGTPSVTQSYNISGVNLTTDISVSAPSGFEISLSNNSGFNSSLTLSQTNGSVPSTPVFVRLIGAVQGSYSGSIAHISTNATTQNITISGVVNAPFNGQNYLFLRGNFHAHSSYSDGNQDAATSGISTPAQNFAYARLSAQIDFWGISEHNHSQAGMNLPDYAKGLQEAINETTPSFTALLGLEYGVISNGGHCLLYGVDSLVGWEAGNYLIYNAQYDYNHLYRIVNDRPNSWLSLAHPQTGDYGGLLTTQPYNASADSAVCGLAIRSGSAFSTTTNYSDPAATLYETEFKEALSKGYHIAPEIQHDNHNSTHGRTNKGRTVILAAANNKASITEAIRSRRFYASDDWNAQVNFSVSGKIMGSIADIGGNPSIAVSVTDPDNETASLIELWYGVSGSNMNATLLTSISNSNSLNYTHNIALNSKFYYYVKIRQGDNDLIWTAPVWVTKISDIVAIDLLDFKAEAKEKDKTVEISWSAEQTGSAQYIVQRSANGESFEDIGKIESPKSGAVHFTFIDQKPNIGFSYYRLKQIDTDGSFKFSNIAAIYFRPLWLTLKNISPNPTSDFINIIFDAEKSSSSLGYFIYDADGKAVLYKPITVREGENILTIDASKLPIGLYYINIGKRDDRQIQSKFIKY